MNDYRKRTWNELAEAEKRDLTDAEARHYQILAEQVGYPWYGHAAQVVVVALCDYEDCDQARIDGSDFCAVHDAEHRANMAGYDVEPPGDFDPWEAERKTGELSQAARQALLDAGAYDNRD